MKTLTERLYEYLEVRRAMGYDLSFPERVMKKFTAYADESVNAGLKVPHLAD